MKVDSEGRIRNVFWADARSRRAYRFFGDVMVFDTKFNTNRYGMVFSPLLGVNNHRQTVLFGCAFLTSETMNSFVWLFEEFKKAMPGEPPKMIITDQDAAMSKAIALTLPTTFHRYCIWHILNKFMNAIALTLPTTFHRYCIWHILNKFMEKPGIGECFSEMCKCIWGMDTKEEFDAKWDEIITSNGLKDHPWLSSIHALLENWVPSYVKHVFLARMSNSQWAESCHSFFKQYINRKNTLMEFILRFERALGSQRHKELMADHVDTNEKTPLPFRTPMQHQMTRIYTREILELFEREDFKNLLCLFELVEQDETQCRYKVSEQRSKLYKVAGDLIDSALLCDEGFELLENLFDDIHGKLTRLLSSRARVEEEPNGEVGTSSPEVRMKDPHRVKAKCFSSSDAKVGAAVDENLQPSQSTQDRKPTITESFMQEFDFIYGPGV
ncbi:protein FAR1-RELATED SEQUENCE 5-like [Prunus avium]|uniref:Protein FAR1-RELATED SEQUENCE n=1 Tax=Prunus avium TaxID=42229 RepID=A0A6P5TKJ2_PRUAV|nr:protein FAR1-RELATED SEQUENCE 5-like [Prunus avium]